MARQELRPTEHFGLVTWLGRLPEPREILSSDAVSELELSFDGIVGEIHEAPVRAACSRVTLLYPVGTRIRNTRQLTILSVEEVEASARKMGLDVLDPALLGANVVIAGIPDFTHVPPSSRLQADGGATVVIDRINIPCNHPARAIERAHPGVGKLFKAAATGRRGVTAWVECEGVLKIGERLRLHVPDQRAWQPSQGKVV